MAVSAAEAATFPADHVDYLLVQHMLAGLNTPEAIAKQLAEAGVTEVTIQQRLLDPVRCAWISQQILHGIGTRLGQLMLAVYGRAVTTGDPNAAKLVLQQYNALIEPVARTEHVNMTVDFSKLPKEMLEKMVQDKMRNLGMKKRPVENAECEVKE
jgi:predicted Rdx family selenoprotein